MTAAAEATHRTPAHPLGRGGIAGPPPGPRDGVPPPTPPEAHVGPTSAAAAVIFYSPPSPSGEGLGRLPLQAYSKGDRLYAAGAPALASYVIEAGLVALELTTPKARTVALAGPGDVVGALAPGHGAHLESATALSGEVTARVLDERTLAEVAPAEVSGLLLHAAAARVLALTQALEDAEHPVPARVARTFLRLGSRYGQSLADGTVRLTLPLTHDTLAAMVGAARETTTAVVARLRELHLIEGTRGSYHLRPAQLADYALEVTLAGS